MVALVDGVPRTLNLREALDGYVDHQIEVDHPAQSKFRLDKARRRAHILEGRIKALDVIDAVIALIRASDDAAAAKTALMAEPFEFSEEQAVDILDMQLRQLTRLSRIDLETELADVRARIAELRRSSPTTSALRTVIKDEMTRDQGRVRHAAGVRDHLDTGEMSIEDLVDDKELVVVMTEAQYVKSVQADVVQDPGPRRPWRQRRQAQDRRHRAPRDLHHRPRLPAVLLQPRAGCTGCGRSTSPSASAPPRACRSSTCCRCRRARRSRRSSTPATSPASATCSSPPARAPSRRPSFDAYDSSRRDGLIAINLHDGDELVQVIETSGSDDIFMVSRKGTTIRFNENEVRPMGRAAAGVRGMKLQDRATSVVSRRRRPRRHGDPDDHRGGLRQAHPARRFNVQGRGGQGVIGIRLTGKKGEVVAAFMVGLDDEIVAVSSGGVTIRMEVREISSQGRDATGVRVMNLDDGQTVAIASRRSSPATTDARLSRRRHRRRRSPAEPDQSSEVRMPTVRDRGSMFVLTVLVAPGVHGRRELALVPVLAA